MNLRKNVFGILNITTQPHSPEKYINLFYAAFQNGKNGVDEKYYGEKRGIIGKLITLNNIPNALIGALYIFTTIDKNKPWLNREKLNEAEDFEKNEIQIPDYLRPNLNICHFIFDAINHKLYFETRNKKDETFGPKNIEKLFNNILNNNMLFQEYGQVDVTLVPKSNVVDNLLDNPIIKKLEIRITPPNPDDLADAEREVMERLNKLNAKTEEINYTAANENGLSIDDNTKMIARIASTNGIVSIRAINKEGQLTRDSTRDYPCMEFFDADPELGIETILKNFLQKRRAQ